LIYDYFITKGVAVSSNLFRVFGFGQLVLAAAMVVCVVIEPKYFWATNQGGVSNYGALDETRLLFTAGFAAAAVASFWVSRKITVGSIKLWLAGLSLL
jgi:hypothetical protein